MLEQQLDDLDNNEARPLYLGKCREDGNTDRVSLLAEISASIDDYGETRRDLMTQRF
jgi:hypothetical protein